MPSLCFLNVASIHPVIIHKKILQGSNLTYRYRTVNEGHLYQTNSGIDSIQYHLQLTCACLRRTKNDTIKAEHLYDCTRFQSLNAQRTAVSPC